jgi:nicotinamidase-related amidase
MSQTSYGALKQTDMKDKLVLKIGLILIFISLNLFQIKAFSQERYLIVLDIQEFPKKSMLLDSAVMKMIQNVNSLISHFKTENVIYIKATGKAINISLKGFSIDTLPAPNLDRTLNIVSKNIFIKVEGDAFTSPELMSFLESKKVKRIVLVGLMAEKCIYDTALGGKDKGYDIMIVPEGIVGMSQEKKDKAIEKMKDKGIEFMPMTEIINAP